MLVATMDKSDARTQPINNDVTLHDHRGNDNRYPIHNYFQVMKYVIHPNECVNVLVMHTMKSCVKEFGMQQSIQK